jgi:hypothetical protein
MIGKNAGNWTITIHGRGPHSNNDANDANNVVKAVCGELSVSGHEIRSVNFESERNIRPAIAKWINTTFYSDGNGAAPGRITPDEYDEIVTAIKARQTLKQQPDTYHYREPGETGGVPDRGPQ